MQEDSALSRTFFSRTNRLAVLLGLQIEELPEIAGFKRRTFFECRSADSKVSDKSWAKLEAAERKAAALQGKGVYQPGNAESSANLNKSELGESACVVREEPAIYGAKKTTLTEDDLVLAFRKIREGLVLLERIMNKPKP